MLKKGGLAVYGGVVISEDTIVASDSDSVEKISESKKKVISENFDKIIFENISESVLVSIDNNNEQSVYISASSSVQSAVESYIEDRALKIYFKEKIETNIPIDISLKEKNIKIPSSKGSADIHIEKINEDSFEKKFRRIICEG